MEGGKPPRGCKQSLRPYEKTPIYLVGDDLPGVPKKCKCYYLKEGYALFFFSQNSTIGRMIRNLSNYS